MNSSLSPSNGAGEGSQLPVREQLRSFAARVLEQCGGIVEWRRFAEAGTAVVPPEVVRLLGVGETVPLVAQPQPDALCVSLTSEFLDQAELLLNALVPRVAAFCIADPYLKGGDLQAAVDRRFTWHNARVRVRGSAAERVEYHTWSFYVSLKSEDIWESRLQATVNAVSQLPVQMPDVLGLAELLPGPDPVAAAPEQTFAAAAAWVQRQLLEEARPFISRMESRLERDRKRLRNYYAALEREAGSRSRRAAAPPKPEEVASRRQAVKLELDRKLIELAERYQVEASLQPITLVGLQATVLAVELAVERRRARRVHRVYWNPFSKQFEPLGCSRCRQTTFSLAFTDETVDPLCAACHARRP